jgi:hypothetical protein
MRRRGREFDSFGGFVVMVLVGINQFRRFRLFETVFFCKWWSTYGVSKSVWKPSCDKMETDEIRDGMERAIGRSAGKHNRAIDDRNGDRMGMIESKEDRLIKMKNGVVCHSMGHHAACFIIG